MRLGLWSCLLLAPAVAIPAYPGEPLVIQLHGGGSVLDPSGASSVVGEKNTIQSKVEPPKGSAWYKTMAPGTFHSETAGFGATGKSSFTLGLQGNVITFRGAAAVTSSPGEGQGRAVARLLFRIEAKAPGLKKVRIHYTCDASLSQTGVAQVSTHLNVNGTDACMRADMGMKGAFAMTNWVKGPSGVVEVDARSGAASPSADMEFGALSGPRKTGQTGSSSGTITLALEPVF